MVMNQRVLQNAGNKETVSRQGLCPMELVK